MKKFTIIAAIFSLSSCTLMPNYQRPKANVSAKWSQNLIKIEEVNLDKKQEQDAENVSWKVFFQNQELQDIIEIALKNNSDLKIAALNIQSTQELYNIKRADLFPSISANSSFNRQKITKNSSNFGFSGRTIIQQQYKVGLSASFELDLFGRIQSLKRAALQDFFAKNETKNALKISLIAQVASIYMQLVADQEKLNLAQKLVENYQKSYDMQAAGLKHGVISRITFAQAQFDLQQAISNQAVMSSIVDQDKNQLILLMGEKSDEKIKILAQKDIKITQTNLDNLSSEILLLRPDIMSAEHELQSANANIGAARASFFPSISLTSFYGVASAKFSNLTNNGSRGSWNFSPQVTLPIFEAGANISNLKISKIEKEIALEKYQKTIQTAFKEVADELAIKKNITIQLEAHRSMSEANNIYYNLSNEKYKKGTSSLFEVLDSEKTLILAKQNETEIQKQYFVNLINLYKVLGGGVN